MITDFLTLDIIQFVCLWVVYRLKWYQVPDSMIHGVHRLCNKISPGVPSGPYSDICQNGMMYKQHLVQIPSLTISQICWNSSCWVIHCSLETPKRVIGKQCISRSDAAECGIWSGSPLFANSSTIFLLEYLNHRVTYLKSKLEYSSI